MALGVLGGGRPICLLLLFGAVLTASLVNGECVVGICCCYSDSYNASYKAEIEGFSNPPTPPEYQYVGIKPKGGDNFEPCFCSDVTVGVMTMVLTKESYVAKALDAALHEDLESDVTNKLNDLKPAMVTAEAELEPVLLYLKATHQSHTINDVTFKVEVVLRGRNEAFTGPMMKVDTSLATALAGKSLGDVDTSSMIIKVLMCSEDPPDAMENGDRAWNAAYVASSIAFYTCKDKYRLSNGKLYEASTCTPVDPPTWTALPEGVFCDIATGNCITPPPAPPLLATSNWNNYSKTEGTEVNYFCHDGYSSEDGLLAKSECKTGEWTKYNTSFNCILTGCLDMPPSVPTQGVMDWTNTRANGTVITYTCQTGFKSNTGEDPQVRCYNMTWSDLPENWACVDKDTKLNLKGALDGAEEEDEKNLFFIVTIPSVGGLVLLIICCLCCTRIDSPIFNVCSPKTRGYTHTA